MPLHTSLVRSIILPSQGLDDISDCLRVSQDPLRVGVDVRELVHTGDGLCPRMRGFVSEKRRKVLIM